MLFLFLQTPPAVVAPAADAFQSTLADAKKAQQSGQMSQAIALFEKCRQIARARNDVRGQWRAAMFLSLCYADSGKAPLDNINASLRYAQEAGGLVDSKLRADWKPTDRDLTHHHLATVYESRARLNVLQPDKAVEDIRLAVKERDKTLQPYHDDLWMMLAVMYMLQLDFDKVDSYVDKINSKALSTDDKFTYFLLQAVVYAAHRDQEGARQAVLEALSLKNADVDPLALLKLKQLKAQFFDKAANLPGDVLLESKLPNSFDVAFQAAMLTMANGLNAVESQPNRARRLLEAASRFFEQHKAEDFLTIAQVALGCLEAQAGDSAQAETHFDRALRVYERRNFNRSELALAGSIQALQPNLYGNYADLLVRDRLPEALALADQGRGQGLKRLALLRKEVKPQVKENVDALTPSSAAQIADLARAHPDTLYLHYNLVDDKHSLLFALSAADGIQTFRLPGAAALEQACGNWISALTLPAEDVTEQIKHPEWQQNEPRWAQDLFVMLLGDVEKAGLLKPGRFKRLVILPDGPLWSVPFAALLDTHDTRLLDRYPITLAVSLALQQEPAAPGQVARLRYIADPFGTDGQPRNAKAHRLDKRDALPKLRETVKTIVAEYAGPNALLQAKGLYGSDVREAQVRALLPDGDVLLIATHGVVTPDVLRIVPPSTPPAKQKLTQTRAPKRTLVGTENTSDKQQSRGLKAYLQLNDQSRGADSAQDGRLEAGEVLQMRLRAQLAILCACGSGQGRFGGGEGLFGLTWAFQGAGCKSVVASEWRVDEEASSLLLKTFWHKITDGQRKDEALQQAMQAIKQKKGCDYPYFWAAFQLYGISAPLNLKRNP